MITVVGIIGFVGLAAPAIAAGLRMRRTGAALLWSSLIGALLLLLTDQIVLSFPITYRLFPVGTITGLLAAPLLIVMIRRRRPTAIAGRRPRAVPRRSKCPVLLLVALAVAALPLLWLALALGRGLDGWTLSSGHTLANLVAWRLPRAVCAFASGAMLALAGAILQRVTANPLASPEILGVSSGAMVGTILFGCLAIPLITRWLDLLSLGEAAALSLGMALIGSRSVLFSITAMMTAAATTLVGPLSFSGLMGPHLAHLIGFRRPASHLLGSTMIGGLVLLTADWAGRNLIFPYQIPAGQLATLIGGPFSAVPDRKKDMKRSSSFRTLEVLSSTRIAPRMQRLRLAGFDLHHFETNANLHARLHVPARGDSVSLDAFRAFMASETKGIETCKFSIYARPALRVAHSHSLSDC